MNAGTGQTRFFDTRQNVAGASLPYGGAQHAGGAMDGDVVMLDIRAFFLMLWRRKSVIVGMVLIGVSLTVMALAIIKPEYTARSLILVEDSHKGALPAEFGSFVDTVKFNSTLVMNEIEVIRSRNTARKVIEQLDLLGDPELNAGNKNALHAYMPQTPERNQGYKSLNLFKDELARLPPEIAEQQMNAVVTQFLQNLSVRAIAGSYAIQVDYMSRDPSKAALVANTVADIYIEGRLEDRLGASRRLTDWLDGRLRELRDQVRQSELAVADYRARNNLTEGIRTLVTTEQMSQLNVQLMNAKAALAETKARRSQMDSLNAGGGNIEASGDILKAPFVQQLRAEEADLARMKSDLSRRYGDRHPAMIKVNSDLAATRAKINQEMQKVAASLANEVAVENARVQALQSSLDELKNVSDGENEKTIRLNELQREAESNRLIFDNFLQTYKRSDEQDKLQEAQARVISYAAIPAKPAYPNTWLFLTLGAALSLFLGTFLAFLLEKMDNKFRSASQLEKYCGYPCFALIPAVKSKSQTEILQYVLDKPSSTVAEAVRTLRTVMNLRGRQRGDKPKVVTVTSSLPGEGKTTLSGWMGRLAAKSGEKVILIDADLRRPNVHRSFGHANDVTLVDYLTNKKSLKEVVFKDDPSGLHMIFAKSVPNSALDLVGSKRMETLIAALRAEYDLIILDSPASMAVSDARILATYSDATIYTVAWDKTPREVVMSGVKQFSDMGYKQLAFSLTNVDVKRHVRYGYGDTAYYYGNYQEE